MALLATLAHAGSGLDRARLDLASVHDVVVAPHAAGLLRLIHERPIAGILLDLSLSEPELVNLLSNVRHTYPRLLTVVVSGARPSPQLLLEVGRRRQIRFLLEREIEWRSDRLMAEVSSGLRQGLAGRLLRPLSRMVPTWEASVALRAVEDFHRGFSAEAFSTAVGYSRPALSERLREAGLPPVGRFLTWIRLFHAAWWMADPGRTGESVARQLEYSSPSAFRRAVRNALGVTPGRLTAGDGFSMVWMRFLAECRLPSLPQNTGLPRSSQGGSAGTFETRPSALY